jgi:hypothetical protein
MSNRPEKQLKNRLSSIQYPFVGDWAHRVSFGYAGYAFIKILLPQHEQNVTPLSQEGEYRTTGHHQKDFSFSIFFL